MARNQEAAGFARRVDGPTANPFASSACDHRRRPAKLMEMTMTDPVQAIHGYTAAHPNADDAPMGDRSGRPVADAPDETTAALDALIRRCEGFVQRAEAVQRTAGPAALLAVVRQVADQVRDHLADADRLRSIPTADAALGARALSGGHGHGDAIDAALLARRPDMPEFATGAAPGAASAALHHAPADASGLSPHMLASDADAADVIAHELFAIAEQADAALARASDGRLAPLRPMANALRAAGDRVLTVEAGLAERPV